MSDLVDFLVWLQREFKAGRTPVQMRNHIAYLVFEFLKQQEIERGPYYKELEG